MNDNLATSLSRAIDRFREQTHSEFTTRLTNDILEPMAHELEILSSEIEHTQFELSRLETELKENTPDRA